jgi:PPP family 3-phenylpropionic acid transporter
VFWGMALMGLLALFVKVELLQSQVNDVSVHKAEPEAQN